MAVTLPKICSAVVIDSSNSDIYASDSVTTGFYTATITPGTYYVTGDGSSSDLMQAIQDALDAASATTWNHLFDSPTIITLFADAATWEVDWNHVNTTFDGSILGIADLSAAWGSAGVEVADYQHKHAWFGTQGVVNDDAPFPVQDIKDTVTKSRAVSQLVIGSEATMRRAEIGFEPRYKWAPTDNYQNQDWQSFLTTARGQLVRYYPDATQTAAYTKYTVPTGYWTGRISADTSRDGSAARMSSGNALYSWSFDMYEAV